MHFDQATARRRGATPQALRAWKGTTSLCIELRGDRGCQLHKIERVVPQGRAAVGVSEQDETVDWHTVSVGAVSAGQWDAAPSKQCQLKRDSSRATAGAPPPVSGTSGTRQHLIEHWKSFPSRGIWPFHNLQSRWSQSVSANSGSTMPERRSAGRPGRRHAPKQPSESGSLRGDTLREEVCRTAGGGAAPKIRPVLSSANCLYTVTVVALQLREVRPACPTRRHVHRAARPYGSACARLKRGGCLSLPCGDKIVSARFARDI